MAPFYEVTTDGYERRMEKDESVEIKHQSGAFLGSVEIWSDEEAFVKPRDEHSLIRGDYDPATYGLSGRRSLPISDPMLVEKESIVPKNYLVYGVIWKER